MLEQPLFGRRLRELRGKAGLSQAALAGAEISTGYLSRLESGARQPTERVVAYLAKELDVDRSAFEVPINSGSLARALNSATSLDEDETVEKLVIALEGADDEDPQLRWQALWLLARHWRVNGERARELDALKQLTKVADDLGLPELQCRSAAQLARCLRSAGEIRQAVDIAGTAYRTARKAELSVGDTARALAALVSAETEAGRLPDARAHVDELVDLVRNRSDALKAEALWSAATVRVRQGDHEAAGEYLEEAMEGLGSRDDLVLWLRLRLAAASLYLQTNPPRTERSAKRLTEAETVIPFVASPLMEQELLTLQAQLAFHEGRFDDSRATIDELFAKDLRLTYRDQIGIGVLRSRLLLLEGQRKEGLRELRKLGEQAQEASSIDLAAQIWRIVAEALEDA
jgi:transcriptional regulator with XRE-family HTH domain